MSGRNRFSPDTAQTTYEMLWPDGAREEIVGRDQLLAILGDERKLARVTAKSTEPIRQVMRVVRDALDAQADFASSAALAASDQQRAATVVEIRLGERQRLVNAETSAPEDTIRPRRRRPCTPSPAVRMTATISSTAGGSAG